ncbi:MAG: TonB-dependent receptor [Bacteroidota bacterium]
MKRLQLFFLMAMLLPVFSFAQFSLSGKVYDKETKQLLKGASVQVNDAFGMATLDKDGSFQFTHLKKGRVSVKVSFVGYLNYESIISISKDTSIDIFLLKSSFLSDEVIIKATRVEDKAPITVKNIEKKQIQQINLGQDLPFILNNMPSTVVTSDAGAGVGYTGIRIRGSDITRINVTINGIPLNDPESHDVYFVNMPDFASSIDNIQVQRGVGTSSAGVASFGAAINIQTLKCIPDPYAELNLSYGSFNTQKYNLNFGTGLINGHWTVDGRLSKITSDGYIDRAFSDLKSFYVSGTYYGEKSLLKLNIFSGKEHTYQAWYGVPEDLLATDRTYNPYTYKNQTDNYQQDHYQLIWSKEIGKKFNLNLAAHYTHGAGYYEEYKEDQSFADYGLQNVIIQNDTITKTNLIRQRWLDNDFYGTTFSLNYEEKSKLKLTLGGGWNRYEGKHFGKVIWAEYASNSNPEDDYYSNTGVKTDFNMYAKALYHVMGRWSLFADIQYRTLTYSFLGYDNDFLNVDQKVTLNFLNPKIGLTFDLNERNSFYASYGIGNKEPNRDDYVESTPASRPKPERLNDFELGHQFHSKKFSLQTDVFYMKYEQQLTLTGKINDVGSYTRINVPNSHRLGIEFDGSYTAASYLKLFANASISENKIDKFVEYIDNWDDGSQLAIEHHNTDLAFSPSVIASAGVSVFPLKYFYINLSGKYVGKQYLDNTSDEGRMLKDYFTSDIKLSYTIKTKIIKEIEFNLMVNNLFSKKYESNGWTYSYINQGAQSTENYYYPQAGINYLAAIRIKL